MSARAAGLRAQRCALCAGLCLALAATVLRPVTARAEFALPTLLSGTLQLQFGEANDPALAADGGYVVFQGSLADVSGVYRRDLSTGAVELVAGGDAEAPSVSADGRYVAFTTTADLEPLHETSPGQSQGEPEADRGCPEVYVRDMEPEDGEPEYTLAAALNGSDEGIAYLGGCPPGHSGFQGAGARAAHGVALSADGRQVVFTVFSYSNLGASSGCVPPGSPPEYAGCTPPSQVAVRDLATETTTLVSVEPDGQATAGGGAYPSVASEQRLAGQTVEASAAISADGSTVAWEGTNVPAQVPSATEIEGVHHVEAGREAEPLWRRVADGPAAVTERLLNDAGLDFYPFYVEPTEPVVAGSFDQGPPVLSADGRTVAMVSAVPSPAAEGTLAGLNATRLPADAYMARVGASAASPSVTRLTEISNYAAAPAAVGTVDDIAISAGGTRVAFDTTRTQFELPSLTLVSPPSALTGSAETYVGDLERGTLQRVTSTYDGSEPNGDAGLLSFSGDGRTLAFASEATNLFFGDAVTASSEVYLASELPSSAEVTPQLIGAAPAAALGTAPWLLDVSASVATDGSVLVQAQVPGAGRLAVSAGAQLPPAARRSTGRHARKAVRATVAKRQGGKRTKAKSNGGTAVPTRTVARGALSAKAPSELRLRLRVSAPYRALVAVGSGLYAVLRVTFSAPHHKTLVAEIPVTFRRAAHQHKQAARAKAKRKPLGKSGTAR
jgi:WD40-like Beta Propeller Repeat